MLIEEDEEFEIYTLHLGLERLAETRRDAFFIRPSGEEGPTRRSSKCHVTSFRRGGGGHTPCRIFSCMTSPASPCLR